MAEETNNNQPTITHIRTLVSPGISCITLKFYNDRLSLQFMKFIHKSPSGMDQYDRQAPVMTTIDATQAASLAMACKMILSNTVTSDTLKVSLTCNQNVMINLDWQRNSGTQLSITKNGITIPFKFNVGSLQLAQNQQTIETGLYHFSEILHGYLAGINAERHLNKWTEAYAARQPTNATPNTNNQYQQGNRRGGYQRRNFNNAGGYQQPQQQNTFPPVNQMPINEFDVPM